MKKDGLSKLFPDLIVKLHNDDQKLMEMVMKDNEKAFEKLFNKYKKAIGSYIYNLVGDYDLTEELTHEVFLKVYRNRARYDSQYKFTTWLWTIARNTSFDYLRKKKEVLYQDLQAGSEEDEKIAVEQIQDLSQDIEMNAIQKADQEIIEKCLNSLKPRQKNVLILRIFSELPYQEISEMIETSLQATKSLINRAKNALIDCVKKCMEGIS